MASVNNIIIYPSNIESCTIVIEHAGSTETLIRSSFSKNAQADCLYSEPMGGYIDVISATATGYPTPRVTVEETYDGEDTYIDFRPEHLYALGDDTISTEDYIYIDNLVSPTGIFNSQGWASNNAFDWNWHNYSNFNRSIPSYNSNTGKWTIDCTQYVGNNGPSDPGIGDITID